MFIDTHTHLYSEEFDADRNEIIKNAITKGITKLYLPNVDSTSIDGMLQLEKEFPTAKHYLYSVPGVGHTQFGMYTSPVGQKVLFQKF